MSAGPERTAEIIDWILFRIDITVKNWRTWDWEWSGTSQTQTQAGADVHWCTVQAYSELPNYAWYVLAC